MPPINPLILLAVALMGVIGFGILLFVGLRMWNEEQEAKSGSAGTPPAETDKPETKSLGAALFGARGSRPARKDASAHEVLRLLRDNWTGRLIIEVGGQRFHALGEIPDPVLRNAVQTTLRDLHEFGLGAPGHLSAPAPHGEALAAPADAPGTTPPASTAPAPPLGARPAPAPAAAPGAMPPAPAASPAQGAASPPPLIKPSMNPFRQRKILREMERRPEVPLKTIPEHIDEFLQQKLMGTPYIWRGIRVRAGLKGEVVFELDGNSYGAVDEVPDEEVRALIRAALAEWEKTR